MRAQNLNCYEVSISRNFIEAVQWLGMQKILAGMLLEDKNTQFFSKYKGTTLYATKG